MNSNKWQYIEIQQVGVDYSNYAEVEKYDARMQQLRDIKSEITNLIEATNPTAESRVLEFGTGTGEFAIAISEISKHVTAVDVSNAMLDYARKKAEINKINNIDFQHSGFLTFSEPPEQFDIIFTQLALHHLPDFWKSIALNKIYNLLKKGGAFFLKDVVYPSGITNYDSFFSNIIEGVKNSAAEEFTKEYITHIRDEFSTLDWILEGLLHKSGFSILKTNVENEFIYSYLCVKS